MIVVAAKRRCSRPTGHNKNPEFMKTKTHTVLRTINKGR